METKKTEVEKFLEGVNDEKAVNLDESLAPKKEEPTGDPDPEKVPESLKDRQHRRLEKRLQAEREANIAINARLKAYEEFKQNITKELPVDARLVKIFGNDTPEKIELAKHFTEILNETKGAAREEAIKELKEDLKREREAEQKEVESYESSIESGLESIEDEFGIDLTSKNASKSRSEFLDFVAKIAPKHDDGSPKELPDLVGAFEIFQKTKAPATSTRRTDIASRSMQQSGQASAKKEQLDETEKWLNENGIRTRNRWNR